MGEVDKTHLLINPTHVGMNRQPGETFTAKFD